MRFWRVVGAAGVVAMLLGVTASSPAGGAAPKADVLLSGLSSPKALALTTIEPLGNPVVGQGAFGAPGPVLVYNLHRPDRGATTPVTDPTNVTDIATNDDGTAWALGGPMLFLRAQNGDIIPVLDIAAYQQTDPDPDNQADDPAESNPFGLSSLPNGDALVADAANNDVLRVTQAGDVTTMARFGPEMVSTDHIPGFPAPGDQLRGGAHLDRRRQGRRRVRGRAAGLPVPPRHVRHLADRPCGRRRARAR